MQRNNVNRNYGVPLIQIISDKTSTNGNAMEENTLYCTSDFKKKWKIVVGHASCLRKE